MADREPRVPPVNADQDPTEIRRAMEVHDRMIRDQGGTAIPDLGLTAGGDDEFQEQLEAQAEKTLEERFAELERQNASFRLQIEQSLEFVRKVAEHGGNVVREASIDQQRKERRRLSEAMLEGLRRRGGNVIIMINPDPDPKKNWPVPLCHNGHRVEVPRGRPVSIHHKFIECLEHAQQEGHVPVLDREENPHMQMIDQLSYPYTIINNLPVERPDVVQVA